MIQTIISDITAIETYKQLLNGELGRFPKGFWLGEQGKKNAIYITRYLIEEVLVWDYQDIKTKLVAKTFSQYKLGGMLKKVYEQSPYLAIDAAYPGKFKPYSLINAPKEYWNEETTKLAIEELMIKLKLTKSEFISKITKQILIDNDLGGMLDYCNSSPYLALRIAFGDTFNVWDMICVPNGYWTKERAIESVKILIEKELKWDDNDIKKYISKAIFQKYNLRGMLNCIFRDSPYLAINAAYPGRFSPEDFRNKPKCA